MRKMLIEYNQDEDTDIVYERLTEICEELLKNNKILTKWGFFGTWMGPEYGGDIIKDLKWLRGHICQDFSFPFSWSLEYTDEGCTEMPAQRYCAATPLGIPSGSLILKQWHHDGCNVYFLRRYVDGDNPRDAMTADVDCKGLI